MMRRMFPRLNSVESIQIYTFWTTLFLTAVVSVAYLV
jgi:hypothetical protein